MSRPSSSRIGKRRAAALSGNGAEYAAKRAELVQAAAEVFREKGLAAATLNDIAAKLGMDRATLYYYVGSKDELFQECVTETVVLNLARAKAIVSEDISPREKLQRLIAMLINSQVEHYPYMSVYMQEDMHKASAQDTKWAQQMVENTHRLERYFIDTIADGMEAGIFRSDLSKTLIANGLFGMTQWTHRWWVPVGGQSRYSADDLIHVFTSVLLDGIEVDDDKR
ncbi:TetR/AcrR family transcriptional regulator [Streptomyces carpinensis]|uniref:TetR/AcrR family transcriptional regulator n=1 Tax=Streptomyces carpinensis TaxID=66369 RepID=A0ABV1VWE6_9ACTN|nr:TetR/AcrR family transcriptional regulator [Streptomyces carpinensis]